jgi:hypothetical protein
LAGYQKPTTVPLEEGPANTNQWLKIRLGK